MDSFRTASRWSVPPADAACRALASCEESLASSCRVHASAVAVVSWPASSSVTSWSRSSSSLRAPAPEVGSLPGHDLLAHLEEPGEHVGTVGEVGRAPPFADHAEDHPVELDLVLQGASPRTVLLQPREAPAEEHQRWDVHGPVHQRPQLGQPLLVGDPEDHLQDHLEGQCVHPSQRGEGLTLAPPGDLGLRQARDEVLVAAEGLSVEGRHEQRAGALVLGGVDEQQ
jgi:hypothetical protein